MDWANHLAVVIRHHGEDVVFTRGGTTFSTVRGVFQNPYQAGDAGLVGVTGTNPTFAAMTTDLAGVSAGDTIKRGSITYKVRVVRPDDPGGFTVLELRKP